jgi:hypothetical protein
MATRVRTLALLTCVLWLAACELRPAPPPPQDQPASPPPPAAKAAPPAPSLPPEAVPPTPPKEEAKPDVSDACVQVGVKVAEVLISAETDPANRTALEQQRTRIVRRTAEACTAQEWSDAARACYLAAKQPADLNECERKMREPPPAR